MIEKSLLTFVISGDCDKPALQIDPTEGRLLVDALSGRWSYEKNRRDTRAIWHYVADAFSCATDRVDQDGPLAPQKVTVVTANGPIFYG